MFISFCLLTVGRLEQQMSIKRLNKCAGKTHTVHILYAVHEYRLLDMRAS